MKRTLARLPALPLVALALALPAAHADENFVAGLYRNAADNATYIVSGAPTGTGRTAWTLVAAHDTAARFNAVWETGPATGNAVLAGLSHVTTFPAGYGPGRSYGKSGIATAWAAGSTIAASQSGTTLTVSRLNNDGSTAASLSLARESQAATATASTAQFRPGVYRDASGYPYLVSGAPSQAGRTLWSIVSMPGNPRHFNAAWETGAAAGNALLAGAPNVASAPAGYAAGRSYGRQGENSLGWTQGGFIAAAQAGFTLSLSMLASNGATTTQMVLLRDRSAAGALAQGSEDFVPGHYRSTNGARFLLAGSAAGAGRSTWTLSSESSPALLNATWQAGPAAGNAVVAGNAIVASMPESFLPGRSYGYAGDNAFGWFSDMPLAVARAGATIVLMPQGGLGALNNLLVLALDSALAAGAGGGTEDYTAAADYQDAQGNAFSVAQGSPSWTITATAGITFNLAFVPGPIAANPLFAGNPLPAAYPEGYAAGRSYGIVGANSIGWTVGSHAAVVRTGDTVSVSRLYNDGPTLTSFNITRGGTGGAGGAGAVSFDAPAYLVNTLDGKATVAITRTGGAAGAASVSLDTADGTAVAGTDYAAVAGATVSWPAGGAARELVEITIPATARAGKSFTVTLSGPAGAAAGDRMVATVTIADTALAFTNPFGSPPASPDFNADGKADLAWREASPGTGVSWWTMSGNAVLASNFHDVPAEWQVADAGDLDGDGKADFVWRRAADGAAYLWILDGFAFKGFADLGILDPAQWSLAGVADLDGDGRGDLVWRGADGTVYAWLMHGGTIASQGVIGNPGAQWVIADLADMDGDGAADIVFRNVNDGGVYVYFMNGLAVASGGYAGAVDPVAWVLVGAADFDGDGKADLLWRHASGDTWAWLMDGAAFRSAGGLGNPGTDWSVRAIGDLDGDGKADLLWRHADGTAYLWKLDGASVSAYLPVPAPGGTWQVVVP